MKRIVIWGAGNYAEHVYNMINREVCIIEGIIDSDQGKQGKLWKNDIMIFSPDCLSRLEYDYIILSMMQYKSVENQCIEMKISREKIIAYWNDLDGDGIFKNQALEILKEQKKRRIYETRLDSAPFEWGLKRIPHIESGEKLLRKMIYDRSSLCRFGDGEFEIMRGKNRPWFQTGSDSLRNRLNEVIHSKNEMINIAIAQNFLCLENLKEEAADEIREYMAFQTRADIIKMLDMNRIYYDTYVTRPYIIYKDRKNADTIFPLFKQLWKSRSVIMVEGKYARNGINNDLFDDSDNIKRVVCPPQNAWSKYDEIRKQVLNVAEKQDLICISLGPAATVLAYDLASMGYQSIDMGQLDNEYEWYLMRAKERSAIKGKMVAEVADNSTVEAFINEVYSSQIVAVIE